MSQPYFNTSFDEYVRIARRDKVLYTPKRAKNKDVTLSTDTNKKDEPKSLNLTITNEQLTQIERILL